MNGEVSLRNNYDDEYDEVTVRTIDPSTYVYIYATESTVVVGDMIGLTVSETNNGDCDLTNVNVKVYANDELVYTLDTNSDYYAGGDTDEDGILDDGETWNWYIPEVVVDEDTTYVRTGYPPEVLRPSGSGTYTQCDNQGDWPNWECVDEETPDGSSTYVSTGSSDTERDTYNLQDHTSGSGTINSVTVHIRSRASYYWQDMGFQTMIRTYGNSYSCSARNHRQLERVFRELCRQFSIETAIPQYEPGDGTQLSLL